MKAKLWDRYFTKLLMSHIIYLIATYLLCSLLLHALSVIAVKQLQKFTLSQLLIHADQFQFVLCRFLNGAT